jgi:glycosyltransferase involved in cell wall biosynthesis
MIPHGVSDAFYPLSPARPGRWHGNAVTSKDAAKDAIGMHGRTVVLRIDRHIFRKNYAAFFRVMRPVLAAHPELSAVIHAKPYGDEYGNLYELLSREPGAIWEKPDNILGWRHPQYLFTNAHDTWRGLEDEELNVLYNAADLLVTPTMAEGFGLTLAEALACGVPVVSTDYSAIPEVVGPGGICIPPVATITNQYAHEWALVDEPQMSAAVERLISKPALRREMGAAGRRHVARYSWSAAVDAFEALLLGAPAAVAA